MRGPSLRKPEFCARAKRCIGGRNCHRKHVEDGPTLLHGKYELGRLLGHGTFAKVYLARHLQTGKSVAMKVVGKEKVIKVGMMEQVKREISVMKMVEHENIVELHEVMASKSKIYFAMELVRGGELFNKIARGRLKEDLARDGLLHTTCGTPAYVAPEVIGKKGYDGAKADIWSCGVILYVLLAGFLPFQDDNIVAMYRKIYRGDFKCPPWFSSEARRLITKLLDPNPNTRISISKIMDSSWFKKPVPKNIKSNKQEYDFEADEVNYGDKSKQPETLNAFHIISLSEGFDLSPLFEEKKREDKEELRFATTRPASSVISRLEEVAKNMKFNVKKSDSRVRLQGQECGRKGKLAINADIFALTPSFLVVEVKKDNGDTLEYNQFCSKELRPALKDIVWMSTEKNSTLA
ncbi:hypothetical protein Patl1_14785 [Pistacia atlantica]|uniref:Uncharacterized protein n=1 Tax=Pistacia atlantica TaxID=434234 RepID=A0ACC1ATJ3_9ROSI|nr:hypothetical protein Patl1_14785 [Pistacia atlantica]